MIQPKEHFHGSDLEKIEQLYKIKKESIISFSANVNPLGISEKLRSTLASHIDAITSYPDREYTSLRRAIGSYVHTDYQNILVGNGSTELISLFIQFLCPKEALIVSPTYSEYEREIKLSDGKWHYFELKESESFQLDIVRFEASLQKEIDLVILCNPNNPTSSSILQDDMEKIVHLCKKNNTFVLVDETYAEFSADIGRITAIPLTTAYDNLIILRGISKFFAAPGLRLGYAICGNEALKTSVLDKKNPWTINSLAAIAGEIMFQDEDYINKTKEYITLEKNRILERLRTCETYQVYEPSANFILLKIKRNDLTSSEVFETCIREGLMIRDCSSFPYLGNQFIRFCIMKKEDNDRLLDILISL